MKKIMIKFLKFYENYFVRFFKIYVLKDKFLSSHWKWKKDNGEALRYKYLLDENSIVFDLGGYEGEFAQKIYDDYGCYLYIFEPVKEYYEFIVERFKNNNKVKVYNFGLSDKDEIVNISLNDNETSVFLPEGDKQKISLKSASSFINSEDIDTIDLLKINIEGGEFSVLPNLIENNNISNINNLQVQFHNFIDDAENLRAKIRNDLSQTHELTYDYFFVWENWKKK